MANQEQLLKQLEKLTGRYWNLSTSTDVASEGLTQIAVGLNAVLDELREAPMLLAPQQVEIVIDAMTMMLDVFGAEEDDAPKTAKPDIQQFVAAFRAEARKRLAGLSLSLSGVFDSEPSAIEQSIQHLHAIRGGSAMLGLRPIAALSGVMEDVLLAGKRGQFAGWPVRPLLRGFAMLEAAIEDPDSGYDNIVQNITDELQGYLIDDSDPPTRKVEFEEDQPVTDVNIQPLQQRILVVDDVETIAHSVGLILSELDIPIDVAHDGDEALELLRQQPYSLVLSDVAMPNKNGLELTRAIRADEALCDLPVVLLTALSKDDEREAGLEAGANDYVVKGSIGGGELISRVNELLKIAPVVPVRESDEAEFRNVLVVEDIETIAASIAFVLSEGPYHIKLAHNGRDGLAELKHDSFDLVLTDLDMPGMNGIELVEAIRSDNELSHLPVVMLTARNTDEHRQRALDAGVSKFLVKGEVGSGKLLDVIRQLFHED